MKHKKPNFIIESILTTEIYSDRVYSCQPNLIDKTNDLIDKLPDLEQRIEYRNQLNKLAPKPPKEELNDSCLIAQEIMDEFSSLSGSYDLMSIGEALNHFNIDKDSGGYLGIMHAPNVWRKLTGGHEQLKPYKEKINKWVDRCPQRIYSWHEKVFDQWNKKTALFQKIFPDNQAAKQYLSNKRWPEKINCPYCNYSEKVYRIENGERLKCGNISCNKKFSVTVGTIFQNTNVSLIKWFGVMWLLSSPYYRTMSIVQVAKCVGLTYAACWKMVQKIKRSIKNDLSVLVTQGLSQPTL